MKKSFVIIPIVLAFGFSIYAGVFYYRNLRGIKPAITNPPYPITDVVNSQNTSKNPLLLPPGFAIDVFAKNLSDARVLAFDRFGNIWVSRPSEGKISVVVVQQGKAIKTIDILSGLDKPHGLLFDISTPGTLYIAEESKISSISIDYNGAHEPDVLLNVNLVKLVDLPHGDLARHTTRTLSYSPKGDLLVSIGSSCNVCNESSPLRASIQKLEKQSGVWTLTPYTTGLRNSVFMATNPVDGKLWATEMGRDELGDNLPPDELNIIEPGKNYGWPVCYGNRIHDVQFDKNTYIMDPCASTIASAYDLPAHVAPLGLAFVPEEAGWPEEYWLDLLVAYHGSWNRSIPVGYSVERIMFDKHGQIVGEEPFIEGWLTQKNEALGRPVDMKFMNGSLYISDDKAGVIYRVYKKDSAPVEASDSSDMIMVNMPTDGSYSFNFTQTSTTFTGKARGTMYFEASFPVIVTDDFGTIVAQGVAHAQGDWMTEDFVPFVATVSYVDGPTTSTGKISFKKDNPSGLPEHEFTYSVPVTFHP